MGKLKPTAARSSSSKKKSARLAAARSVSAREEARGIRAERGATSTARSTRAETPAASEPVRAPGPGRLDAVMKRGVGFVGQDSPSKAKRKSGSVIRGTPSAVGTLFCGTSGAHDVAPAAPPVVTSDVPAVAAIALSEIISGKELARAKESIADGTTLTFEFDASLRGVISKGIAGEKDSTCTLLNDAVFAELMRRLGVTQKAWETKLFEIAMEAHVKGIRLKDKLIADSPALLTAIYLIKKEIVAKLPKTPVAGSFKVDGRVSVTNLVTFK